MFSNTYSQYTVFSEKKTKMPEISYLLTSHRPRRQLQRLWTGAFPSNSLTPEWDSNL